VRLDGADAPAAREGEIMKLETLLVTCVLLAIPSVVLAQDKEPGGPFPPPGPDGPMVFVQPDGDGPVLRMGDGEGNMVVVQAPAFGPGMVDRMKETLGLTEEQVANLQKIDEETRADMQKLRDDPGGFDPSKVQSVMEKSREKVRSVLNDDQNKKLDQQRGPRVMAGGGGFRVFDAAQRDKMVLERAEKSLKLGSEEKAVVLPLVKKLLDAKTTARQGVDKRRKELGQFLKDVPGATENERAQIAEKIKELAKARAGDEAKVKEAVDALREVLSPENEAMLVTIGILDL
jgi:hypothetical protein